MIEKRQDAVKSRSAEGDAFSALVVRIFQLEGLLAAARLILDQTGTGEIAVSD